MAVFLEGVGVVLWSEESLHVQASFTEGHLSKEGVWYNTALFVKHCKTSRPEVLYREIKKKIIQLTKHNISKNTNTC